MMKSDEIQAIENHKGLNAPCITSDDIEANIAHTEIVTHVSKSGQTLRWAVLTTKNGFSVTGNPSCCVSSQNDDKVLGEKYAIANAKNELWGLMGYALREKLHGTLFNAEQE